MAVRTSYPGVYIDEFAPAPPIQGVGTSTAAFAGPAAGGEIDVPVKVTRWETFQRLFGDLPLPGRYLWYAVRGFFDNGGQVCYVTRVSNGVCAAAGIGNAAGDPVFLVRAAAPGTAGDAIAVRVAHTSLVSGAELYRPSARGTVTGVRQITLATAAESARFRVGDWVRFTGPKTDPRVQVVGIGGGVIRVDRDLISAVNDAGALTLADAVPGTKTIRVKAAGQLGEGALVPGSTLAVVQGTVAETVIAQEVRQEGQVETGAWVYGVTLRQGLAHGLSLDPAGTAPRVSSREFTLTVGSAVYRDLALDPAHPRYYLPLVNDGPVVVRPADPAPADGFPAAGSTNLAGGADEDLGTLDAGDYLRALAALRPIDDVNLLAVPDAADLPDADTLAVQRRIVEDCELLMDRFGVLDPQARDLPPFGAGAAAGIDTQRRTLSSARGYAALYYPWIKVVAADGGPPVLVPPSGHICGAIARVDNTAGVFKAPANVYLNGALDIQANGNLIDAEHGELNLMGINVIRVLQGGRPLLMGARTIADDLNWQYVSVRRLFLFLEESIQQGIGWAVFEPNNLELWQKLKRALNAFLHRQWQDGALFGATADDAFQVQIDEALNPPDEQRLGRLHIRIALRPTYPAEFVVVHIGIWDGGAEISEG
ncbi:phage tail sheath subtilisin-like domain-containing protein [Nonomuraea sp. B12E4]|uniref:phage tail sheath family protein n=1 Tax=Nonomuraea sp. B12E4 TaxID=3153564 RepID=UPI00325E0C90